MKELNEFVKSALAVGRNREEIRSVLQQAGWSTDEIEDALSRFAELPFPVPVPTRRYSTSAQEVFLYLVTFVALYISAVSLGGLLFMLVDYMLPDPVTQGAAWWDPWVMTRWHLASLLVAFPIYLSLSIMHLRHYANQPERRTSAIRRWLTYLTLFVAAVVILSTVIGLVANLLGGELAVRVLLKSAITLAIAGGVFYYYRWEMQEYGGSKR